jgi:hypothetical protein
MNTSGTGQKQLPIVYNYRELTSEEIDLVDGGCLPEPIRKAVADVITNVYGLGAAILYTASVADGICK